MRDVRRPDGSRRLLIAGNWKMNKTYRQAVDLTQAIVDSLERDWKSQADVVLCPPFTALRGVSNVIAFAHSWAQVGAQDCSFEDEGAFTGQISVSMLTDLDCVYCIVGHSERRGLLGETSADVAKKVIALEKAQVTPILCVGEQRDVYEAGNTEAFVVEEVRASLEGVAELPAGISIAYEPIWAIGTGLVPAPEHAQRVAQAIRQELHALLGEKIADEARILYGGSVKPGNVKQFVSCPDVDGALIGGASLDADSFCRIVENAIG